MFFSVFLVFVAFSRVSSVVLRFLCVFEADRVFFQVFSIVFWVFAVVLLFRYSRAGQAVEGLESAQGPRGDERKFKYRYK